MFVPMLSECATPLYEQLYQQVKQAIADGTIATGAKLPSKRNMAQQLNVSQTTVQTAYDQLAAEGFIATKERSGYFVQDIGHWGQIKGPVPKPVQPETDPNEAMIDFSYQGVDPEHFPFRTFQRLAKQLWGEEKPDFLKQGDPQGYLPLRQKVAEYLWAARNVRCHADQVVISSGTEYLFHLLCLILPRQTVFGVENPGSRRLPQLLRRQQADHFPVPLDEEGVCPEAAERLGVDVLCCTPSHQFPMGTIMPIQRRTRLLDWALGSSNRFIIEDDYDSEFKYGGLPVPSLQGLDGSGRVIYLGSTAKSISPSLRISYMVLPENLLMAYRTSLAYMVCPVPLFEQMLLFRFIEEGHFERHLNRMRVVYRRKREYLVKGLQRGVPGIRIRGAEAGLHLLVEPLPGMNERNMLERAGQAGVRVHGLSDYILDSKPKTAFYPGSAVLLGYASLAQRHLEQGTKHLITAWLGGLSDWK